MSRTSEPLRRLLRSPSSPVRVFVAAVTLIGIGGTITIVRRTQVDDVTLTLPTQRGSGHVRATSDPPVASTAPGPPLQANKGGYPSTSLGPAQGAPAVPGFRWGPVSILATVAGTAADSGLTAVAAVPGEGFIAVGAADGTPVVLVSADGTQWSRVESAERALKGAVLRDVAVVAGQLTVVGSLAAAPAAWTSSDALTWKRVPVNDWGNAIGVGLLESIAEGPLGTVVAVGFSAGSVGIWRLDGGAFVAATDLHPLPKEGEVLAQVAATPAGLLAGGNDAGGNPVVWRSHDGRQWTRSTLPASGRRASVAAIGELGERVVAAGYDGLGGKLWSSADGITWEETPTRLEGEGRPQALLAVADSPNGGVVAGQRPGGPLCLGSADGVSFLRCTSEEGSAVTAVRSLAATSYGFIAVGAAAVPGGRPHIAIWRVEPVKATALAR